MKAEISTTTQQVLVPQHVTTTVVQVEMSVEDAMNLKEFLGILSTSKVQRLVDVARPKRSSAAPDMYRTTYVMYSALDDALRGR